MLRLLILLVVLGLAVLLYNQFINREPVQDTSKQVAAGETGVVEARRGSILDRFGTPLAFSLVDSSLYVKPREFADISGTTEKLAAQLGVNADELLAELKTQKSFIWLARHLPYRKVSQVAGLNLAGVYIFNKVKRVYPHNFKVPGIIGEVSQEEGLSGLEYYYNDLLMGRNTAEDLPRDVFLTLDLKTQILLEESLSSLLNELKPQNDEAGGKTILKAVVMGYETGGIIACAQQSSSSAGSLSAISMAEQSAGFFSEYVDPGGFEELFRQAAILKFHRGKRSDNGTDDLPVIMPTGLKSDINPPPEPVWRKSEEGDFLYPWFARVVDKMELTGDLSGAEHTLSDLELAAFSAGLGFSTPMELDLPGREFLEPLSEENGAFLVDKKAKVLPLHLLTAFSCVMTGGARQPHFLKVAFSEKGEAVKYENKDVGGGICQGIEEDLQVSMRGATGKDPLFILESLQPRGGCRLDDNASRQCVNGVTLALNRGGQPGERETGLVMLLTIEKGEVDLYRRSPVKPVIRRFLSIASRNLGQQKKLNPEQIKKKGEEALTEWLLTKSEKDARVQDSDVQSVQEMPDLGGMSIRRALRVLQNRGLQVFVHGSGIVVRQRPEPGDRGDGSRCVLTADFKKKVEGREKQADDSQ